MFDNLDSLDQWAIAFERRSLGRTKIDKGALIFFSEKAGVHPCTVRDATNAGVGIRSENCQLIPIEFALSFDNFRTLRECRLIWRDGDFLGVAFQN
jgi:hypothetical protein